MEKLKSIMCRIISVITLCTLILPLTPTIDVKAVSSDVDLEIVSDYSKLCASSGVWAFYGNKVSPTDRLKASSNDTNDKFLDNTFTGVAPTEDFPTPAYQIGISAANRIKLKSGNFLSFSNTTKFDIQTISEDIGEVVPVYYTYVGEDRDSFDWFAFVGCDYSIQDDKYYYTVHLACNEGDVVYCDCYYFSVFKSDKLVKFGFFSDKGDNPLYLDENNISEGSSNNYVFKYNEDIVNILTDKVPLETITTDIENSTYSNTIYDKLGNCIKYDGTNNKISFKAEKRAVLVLGNAGVDVVKYDSTLEYNDLNAMETLKIQSYNLPNGLEMSKDIFTNECEIDDTDFVNFGDANSTSRESDGSLKPLSTWVCKVVQAACFAKVYGDDFDTAVDKFVDGHDNVICDILKDFHVAMKSNRQGWEFNDQLSAQTLAEINNKTSLTNDNYEIMSYILEWNITCMANSEKVFCSVTKPMYVTTADGRNIYLSNNWNDSDNSNLGMASIHDIWNSLTDYQKDVLGSVYTELSKRHESLGDWPNRAIYYISSIGSNMSSKSYDSTIGEDFSNNNQGILDTIKTTIDNKDTNILDTNSIYNIARNCNMLGQYIIGTSLYGENDTDSIYSIYDATLASLMVKDYTFLDLNKDYFPDKFPANIGLFGGNSYQYTVLKSSSEGQLQIFASFLYKVSYAFDVAAFSNGGEELKYDPEALREFFKSGKYEVSDTGNDYATTVSFSWVTGDGVGSLDGKTVQFSGDDVSKNMLRSIIELHDMCQFLGILDSAKNGGWTEAIEQYLGIYDDNEPFFNALRSNPEIYTKAEEGKTTADEPLGVFFNLKDKKMSDQWCKGFAVSALYVPMETNLYDANSIAYLNDPDFISDFYYKFAFYRKALYINTDNSAIVNNKVSGEVSGTRVATLNDLLNYDRDIILTIDDNFYNAKDISSVIGGLDYSAVRNGSSTNTDSAWDSMKNWVGDLFDLSPEQILKTGANSYYSSTLANSVTKLGGTPSLTSSIADVYVLSENDLIGENSVFNDYEYSVKQSYGVVSAVYRSAELYNECLRALATDNAIFKSSKGICSTPGTTSSDWRSIYNYCMLSNLEEQMKNDSASTLDLNAPIFCDLFGNIVTESGLVIIPAATNATLCGTNWNPNTVGWSEYYNNGNRLHIDEFTDDVYTWLTGIEYKSDGSVEQQVQYVDHYDDDGNPIYKTYTITAADSTNVGKYGEEVNRENAGGYMIVDRSGDLVLRTSSLTSGSSSAIVQWENLNKNSTVVKDLFYNDAYFNKAKSGDIYSKTLVNMVVETLRGAPIEYIDYEYEGLSGNTDISKFGVYMAYKLEELTNALISGTNGRHTGGNSMVTIPNPAFITGIEYIALYVFKITFAILLIGFVISLYMDAIKNHLGIKSLGKFAVTCLLTIIAIVFVPNIMSWSYYRANKDLLADESGYIMMLNYVKDYDGAEIGITSISTPETNTELYVKLDDISVNWWDVIGEVLFNNTYKTVSELYQSQLTDNAMAMQENVQIKGDGLYMNVQDIFDSTSVVYYPSQNRIANIAYSNGGNGDTAGDKDSVVSFCMPYYVILDKLIANIDEYNQSKDITAYSWSVGSNGHIMTYDIISPYLTSSEFLDEGYDILGLNEALDTDNHMTSYTEGYFTTAQKYRMKLSRWYPTGSTTDQLTQDRINAVYSYARDYIAQNREILGKVPDEVFIKTFAIQLAIEFNKQFNVHTTNSIEIMNVDTRDLARFLVADKSSVYKYFSYGFARFAYEESGTIGVILAALYFVVLWITSVLKLLAIFVILGLLILNVLFRKTLFRKESRCIEGYLIACACLVMCNYAYSLMLKASMLVSETGLGSIAGLSLAIIVQILYVFGLTCIVAIECKDWRNNGFHGFQEIGASITSGLLHAQNVVADKIMSRQNSAYGDSRTSRRYQSDNYDSGSVDEMMERDEEREEKGTYSPA